MVPKKKIQDYTADAMREAMDDVQLNNLSIRGSAKLHNIPESTLRGRLSDPRGVNVRMGGPTIFTPNQEDMGMQDGRYWRLQVICQRLKE